MCEYASVRESSRKFSGRFAKVRESSRQSSQEFATSSRKFSTSSRHIRRFAKVRKSSRPIRKFARVRKSSREFARVRKSSQQVRESSRQGSQEFATSSRKFSKNSQVRMEVRKDTRLVHIGYSKFAAVYLRMEHFTLRAPVGKSDGVRTTVSVKTLTVSSVEELNTRSMSLHTRPCDLLVTDDSHMSDAVSSRALSTSRHFWPRTQMGLRSGVRARFDTVSSTEHRSPNAGRVGT